MNKNYIFFIIFLLCLTGIITSCANNKPVVQTPEFTLIVIDNHSNSDDLTNNINFKSQLIKSFERISKNHSISANFIHLSTNGKKDKFTHLHKNINDVLKKKIKVLFIFNFSDDINNASIEVLEILSNQNPQTLFISNLESSGFSDNVITLNIDVRETGLNLGYLSSFYIYKQLSNEVLLSRSRTNPETLVDDIYKHRKLESNQNNSDIKIAFFAGHSNSELDWYKAFKYGVEGFNQTYSTKYQVDLYQPMKEQNPEKVREIAIQAIDNNAKYFVFANSEHLNILLDICREKRIKIIGTDLDFYFYFPVYQDLVIMSGIKDINKLFDYIFETLVSGNDLPKKLQANFSNNFVTVSEMRSFNFEVTDKVKNEIKKLSQ